ncbi:Translationally-controlled tumor protein [Wickerhamomyces ciferrii]|uniref:Translationally-controlled tumor protein homolog n=1 Tax=Wickerhamomyces ciferrii (strain ATCC 14091 / BCRC 22168 / CBS 111 / JCM 3599 / NBRC 0793 / NRRL Y-1031 F-60-10) TaxID=1206466 RepID=K0KWD6_WICCF|nr:Translationally-controlled tumor protein [Wickerhamomyces ciferrii]CCH46267.1 Translationally-controlled tumor protein [Wickerhamomyces ciferrii]
MIIYQILSAFHQIFQQYNVKKYWLTSFKQDIFSNDELLSDSYEPKLVDGVVYEADCANIVVGDDNIDIGANPSAEDAEEGVDSSKETVNNIVYNFRLQQTAFDKKSFLVYIKDYMKRVEKYLQEKNPDEVDTFKKGAATYVKKVIGSFKDWEFFTGESMDPDAMIVLMNYREDGTTPYVCVWKHGISENKV